ncbi:hypothetical protein, partial [Burkholderia sp. RF2-non_BP3]|uniref:hypothetical protein n=2 Tax=Burkholderia TaxID=32008 RepID=UPI0015D0A736
MTLKSCVHRGWNPREDRQRIDPVIERLNQRRKTPRFVSHVREPHRQSYLRVDRECVGHRNDVRKPSIDERVG